MSMPVPGTGKAKRLKGLHRFRRWNQNHWAKRGRWRHGAQWYDDKARRQDEQH